MSDNETQPQTIEADTGTDAVVEQAEKVEAPTPPGKPGGLLTTVALVLAIAGLAASGAVYWQGQQARQQLQGRVASLNSQLGEQRNELEAKLAEQRQLYSQADATITGLDNAFKALREELGRDRGAWAVAETTYYLEVANARLQLLNDVPTALKALTLADTRLQALGDPLYVPVREQLAREITALQGMAQPDLTGTALILSGVAAQIPSLPLHAPTRVVVSNDAATTDVATSEEQPAWKREAEKVWQVMRQLVQVRRTDRRIEPLLQPEEQRLLVANLQLQLQIARYAVLTRDKRLLQDSINIARDWLLQHYDAEAAPTRAVLERLDELDKLELSPEKPDISGALRLLRTLANKGKPAA